MRYRWGGDFLRLKTILLTGLGVLFLGLGAVGLVLPVWPTTPFVLLAAGCFSVSPTLKARLMRLPFFREHIENYENKTGLTRRTLTVSLVWLWGMLLLSVFLVSKPWLIVLLLCVGAAVTGHLLWMSKARGERGEAEE